VDFGDIEAAAVAWSTKHKTKSAAEFRSDRDAFEIVSFNLMLAVQVCADTVGKADLSVFIRCRPGWKLLLPY
jgi:hypothetical protein